MAQVSRAEAQRVVDIGGLILYAKDPAKLAEWYRQHLGIDWQHDEAERAFYFSFLHREHAEPSRVAGTTLGILERKPGAEVKGQVFMFNYRVANLEKFLEHLRAGGIAVEKVEDYDYGRFAWIADPEGNKIELFEDKG